MSPSEVRPNIVGELRQVSIGSLRLDAANPRLPTSLRGKSQDELAVVLVMGFDAYAVAQSIADNGYFQSEPLLVIASEDASGMWTVVEGNRRLTALIGLTNSSVREQFPDPDAWDLLAARSGITASQTVPVVVHPNRDSTHVEVGKAHVLGKLQWRPYAQATYIAARVHEGRTYAQVSEMIGISKSKVADLYRDQAIVQQAHHFGLNTSEIEKAFSLLTVAMSSTKLRDHVGAPLGSRLEPGAQPVPPDKVNELSELITWIFGNDDLEPKISDSRQISQLGNVVGNEIGVKALRENNTLEQATQRMKASGMSPRDRLISRLTTARQALLSSSDDLTDHVGDAQVRKLLDDAVAAMGALQSIVDEVQSGSEIDG